MSTITFKPTNWSCVVDARISDEDKRSNLIKDAYEKGKRLRLDISGIQFAQKFDIIPIDYVCIDGGARA
jgi:hypothetical protein